LFFRRSLADDQAFMRAACAALVTLSLAIAAPARAQIVVGEGVPFSARELAYALAVRTREVARLAVQVQAAAPGWLRVSAGDGWSDVEIGAAQGAIAARLVALTLVADLELSRGPVLDVAVAPVAPVAPGTPGWSVAVAAGARTGIGSDDLTSMLAAIEVTGGRRWWLAGGFEWHEDLRSAPTGAEPVDGSGWLARGLVGHRLGVVELGVGPLAGRVQLDSGVRVRAWQLGVGAVARAALPITSRWTLLLGAGADGYRHRVEVRRDDIMVAATPRVAVAATVGLRWEPGR
jgi:hypothetical protein